MWPVDKYSWKVEHDFTLIDIGNKAPAFVVRRGDEQGNSKGTKASWARRDVYPENMWCAATCLGSIFELKNWEKGRAK